MLFHIVESLTGREYARTWMHGGHLLLDGKKMVSVRLREEGVYPNIIATHAWAGPHTPTGWMILRNAPRLTDTVSHLAERHRQCDR
jgi:hypothetical protein